MRATLVVGALGSFLSTLWLVMSPIRVLRTVPTPLIEPILDHTSDFPYFAHRSQLEISPESRAMRKVLSSLIS